MINLTQTDLLQYKGQNVITPWDRLKKHIFQPYPIHTAEKIQDFNALLEIGLKYQDKADMVWVVDSSAAIMDEFPWHFRPSDLGKLLIHEFPRVTRRSKHPLVWGDIKLVPTGGVSHGTIQNKIISGYHEADFDIVMISYHESEADEKYLKLKTRFPDIKHVKNVKGIGEAHKEAARISDTQMVWIVDADSDVSPTFNFDFIPPMADRSITTYSWFASNPVNGLEYGYGGLKLFPRDQLLTMGHNLPDFATSSAKYQPVKYVASVTRFNKDPFRTWRSAFRECAKLASGINPNNPSEETLERLHVWTTVDNGVRFGRYCLKGALEGKAFGEKYFDDVEMLNKINDFEWLRLLFVKNMKKQIRTNKDD
jgi:hypothetical protein